MPKAAENLAGSKFGLWTVLKRVARKGVSESPRWLLMCSCGNEKEATTAQIKRGQVGFCKECNPKGLGDRIGFRSGNLVVVAFEKRGDNGQGAYWRCRCDCGNEKVVQSSHLVSKHTKSCGCLPGNPLPVTNFESDRANDERAAWNVVLSGYKNNGTKSGKGWELTDAQAVEMMSKDCMYCGASPDQGKTPARNGIDRVDNDRGYSMLNCVPCCWSCNSNKKDTDADDFVTWARRVTEHQEVLFGKGA